MGGTQAVMKLSKKWSIDRSQWATSSIAMEPSGGESAKENPKNNSQWHRQHPPHAGVNDPERTSSWVEQGGGRITAWSPARLLLEPSHWSVSTMELVMEEQNRFRSLEKHSGWQMAANWEERHHTARQWPVTARLHRRIMKTMSQVNEETITKTEKLQKTNKRRMWWC